MALQTSQATIPRQIRKECVMTKSIDGPLSFRNLNYKTRCRFWLCFLGSSAVYIGWLLLAVLWSAMISRQNKEMQHHEKRAGFGSKSQTLSVDVWFALSLPASIDAIASVLSFNRVIIRRFHYAISQRLMFVASMASFIVFKCNNNIPNVISEHILFCICLCIVTVVLFGSLLDRFDAKVQLDRTQCSRRTLWNYCADLNISETSWREALFHTAVVSGVGFVLTAGVPRQWSALVPIIHIAFETLFLSSIGARRTPRYLLLCSPPFFATICAHWGLATLVTAPRLELNAIGFLCLTITSRLILDILLRTTLRQRLDLQWARKEVVIPTKQLLMVCIAMLILENIGIKVITYVKPISVIGMYSSGAFGLLSVAAFNVAIKTD